MKRIVFLSTMFAAVAILGTALSDAAPDEASAPKETSAKSATPCCLDKPVDGSEVVAETDKSDCCPRGQAKAAVLAQTEVCSGNSCNAGKQMAGGCPLCAAAKGVSTAQVGVQKCKSCNAEDCKEECSICAAARKEAEASGNDLSATDGNGRGMGRGRGMGPGHAGDSQHEKDHKDFFFLIEHRDSIRRTVKNLPNGIETLTESDAADVAGTIQEHVEAMYDRVENVNPIRMRDPLFREIFANADKIRMQVEHTDHGVRVSETSDDAYVVKLLQEHAKVVSLFIKNGYSELPRNHAAPNR